MPRPLCFAFEKQIQVSSVGRGGCVWGLGFGVGELALSLGVWGLHGLESGFWVLGVEFWVLGVGFGFWVLDFGFWVLGLGFGSQGLGSGIAGLGRECPRVYGVRLRL